MNTMLLLLLLAGDPASCPMHAQHTAVDERGDRVMGFSHDKTTHKFLLLEDGGAIEVRANDAKDDESIAQIRTHLREIAKEFTKGEFEKPLAIHARMPDGADVMKERASHLTYTFEELDLGGQVRIKTKDAAAKDAVHAFLRFQIVDHRTGDDMHTHQQTHAH